MARQRRRYGSGCLFRQGRRWAIRWREAEIAPDGTRRKVLRYQTFETRKEASDALNQKLVDIADGRGPIRSRVVFRTLADGWLKTVWPMYKSSTRKNHRHIVQKHLLPRFGAVPVADVTRQEV